MATYRFVSVGGEEVELLADLTGIQNDLEVTIEYCDLLKEMLQGNPRDYRILEALSSAILTRYTRSFGEGVRAKIPESAYEGIGNEMLQDHENFKDFRDKHIAHSVNAFEENHVVAYLNPEEKGKREVLSISVQAFRVVGLGLDDLDKLKSLCNYFLKKVGDLMKVENEKALKYARSLNIDGLYEKEAQAIGAVKSKDAGKQRKKLRYLKT